MPHYLLTRQFCRTLCTLKYGLVSEWVTRANPICFINEILNFGTAVIFQLFHLFIQWIAKSVALFCSFCKVFTLYSSRKTVWKLSVIQTATVPHNSAQVSCEPKRVFRGLVLFCRTKWVSLNFATNKNSQFVNKVFICKLNIQYNARHTASKVNRVENGGQEEFYVKEKE